MPGLPSRPIFAALHNLNISSWRPLSPPEPLIFIAIGTFIAIKALLAPLSRTALSQGLTRPSVPEHLIVRSALIHLSLLRDCGRSRRQLRTSPRFDRQRGDKLRVDVNIYGLWLLTILRIKARVIVRILRRRTGGRGRSGSRSSAVEGGIIYVQV